MKSFTIDCRNLVLNEETSGTLQSKKTGYSLNYHNPVMHDINTITFGQQNSASQGDGVETDFVPTLDKSKVPGIMHEVETSAFCQNQVGDVLVNSEEMHCLNSNATGRNAANVLIADTLTKGANQTKGFQGEAVVYKTKHVRRLTPTEFARLQGFPDDWTRIDVVEEKVTKKGVKRKTKPATDAQQYAAYGNSMTVNVMRWLGERIQAVDDELTMLELLK